MNSLFHEFHRKEPQHRQKLIICCRIVRTFIVLAAAILAFGLDPSVSYAEVTGQSLQTELTQVDLETLKARAESGDAEAQNQLGARYELGVGIAQDYKSAMAWYLKAADKSLPVAMANVGRLYLQGIGVSKDEKLGASWMQRAADLGSDDGQNYVGYAYATGTGYQQDYQKAFEYYSKAADKEIRTLKTIWPTCTQMVDT